MPFGAVDLIMQRLSGRLGFTVCSKKIKVSRGGREAEGYIIAVLLNGRQMMDLPIEIVRQRVLDALLYAQNNLGVNVIGLGSLTTSVTDGGEWVTKQPQVKLAVTHGDTFTVAIAQEGISRIIDKYGISPKKHKAAVVGAYGLIGRELCVFLAKRCFPLVLVESIPEKIELIKKRMIAEGMVGKIIEASTDIKTICECDLVVTATSHPAYLLQSDNIKGAAVIYDIAQPMNVSPALANKRPDVVKIDGDYVDIGEIDLNFPMGPPRGSTFACLTETAMLALEGDTRHHVGGIDKDFLKEVKIMGDKYGFHHAPFTSFGNKLPRN